MNQKLASKSNTMDTVKWTFVLALSAAAVVFNQYFAQHPLAMRVLCILVIAAVAIMTVFTTQKGKRLFAFFKESQVELRKVVWPTRSETVQTTLMVFAVVMIIGLILWGIDVVLLKLVSKLIGYGAH